MANESRADVTWSLKALHIVLGYDVRLLQGTDIEKAKSFLYEVYFLENNWTPPSKNPSELRIENAKFEDTLSHSSVWIGLFAGEGVTELSGVIRVVHGLEVALYLEPDAYRQLRYASTSCELNRLALKNNYSDNVVSVVLILAGLLIAYNRGFTQVYSAVPKEMEAFFVKLGCKRILGFRYHKTDGLSVVVSVSLTFSNLASIIFKTLLLFWTQKINRLLRTRHE